MTADEGLGPDPSSPVLGAVAWPEAWPVARAVAGRPDLWWTALGALWRLAGRGWWRSRPYLPLPASAWWRFRMVTAYGRPDGVPERADVLSYLEWCRSTAPHGHPWPERGEPVADGGRQGSTRSG